MVVPVTPRLNARLRGAKDLVLHGSWTESPGTVSDTSPLREGQLHWDAAGLFP
jgi:hypothetical protein